MASLRTDMIGAVWISTAYRTTYIGALGRDVGYYEIIVWEYDHTENKVGKILYMCDSGSEIKYARKKHEKVVRAFRYLEYRKRRNGYEKRNN